MTDPAIRYLRLVAAATLGILALVVGFNVLVDPYRVWDLAPIRGFNANKPDAYKQEIVGKPYAILRARPSVVLIGSSRTNGSLDPDELETLPGPKNIYNFAISAFGLHDQRRFLEHALAAGGVRTVVLTLEMTDFLKWDNQVQSPDPPGFRRLLLDSAGGPNRWRFVAGVADFFPAFVRLDALVDSLRTVTSQNPANGTETARGWLIKDFVREIGQVGHYALFRQKDRDNASQLAHAPKRLSGPGDLDGGYAELTRIVALCRDHGVALKIILPPFHAHMLELYRMAGLWPTVEQWKRLVLTAAEAWKPQSPSSPGVEVWDFADYDRWTMEPVPPPSDHGLMKWYWESAHYRPTLGNLLWRRIFDPDSAAELAELGEKLDSATLDSRLAAIRGRQAAAKDEIDRQIATIVGGAPSSGPSDPHGD